MPVTVHALPGRAGVGSDGCQTRNGDLRQAEILRAHPCIQPDRAWIKSPVLRKESLGKANPAHTRFVNDIRREHGDVGNGDQLNARRGEGVEPGHQAAADQRKRVALFAVAKVVATGQKVPAVKIVINLGDGAVHAVAEGRQQGGIIADRGLAGIAQTGARQIGSRPGLARENSGRDRIDAAKGHISGDIRRGRHTGETALSARLPLAFVIHEKEGLVAEDGSAEGAAELIVVERRLAIGFEVEVVTRVENGVPEKLQACPVPLVRAALGDNVDHAAGAAPVFGLEVGKHANLSHGFHRQNRGRRAENSGFVDRRVVPVTVVHVRAVEKEVVGAAARPVDREHAERSRGVCDLIGRAGDAGHHVNQLRVIAPIDGQVRCQREPDRAAKGVCGGLDLRENLSRYLDPLRDFTGLEGDVGSALDRDFDSDAGDCGGAEGGLFHSDAVVADGQLAYGVAAVIGRNSFAGLARVQIPDGDLGAADGGTRLIRDRAENRSAKCLRLPRTRKECHYQYHRKHQCGTHTHTPGAGLHFSFLSLGEKHVNE